MQSLVESSEIKYSFAKSNLLFRVSNTVFSQNRELSKNIYTLEKAIKKAISKKLFFKQRQNKKKSKIDFALLESKTRLNVILAKESAKVHLKFKSSLLNKYYFLKKKKDSFLLKKCFSDWRLNTAKITEYALLVHF